EADPLIKVVVDLYNELYAEKDSIMKLNGLLTEESYNLDLLLETWREIQSVSSNLLLKGDVIDDISKPFDFKEVMEFKAQILQDLMSKLEYKRVKVVD
ncbi:hypothetical protein KI387_030381, partial [Taxus chinensis]